MQLRAREKESDAHRRHDELISWRDRRIDAYRELSTLSNQVMTFAATRALSRTHSSLGTLRLSGQELVDAYNDFLRVNQEVLLISDQTRRASAVVLGQGVNSIYYTALECSRARYLLAEHIENRSESSVNSKKPSKDELEKAVDEADEDRTAALNLWRHAHETWINESRLGLAVPD